ncbi:MAG: RNA polymerase sigma factor [Mangrovibacterium sp.]
METLISDRQIWDDFKKGDSYALSYIYYQNIQLLYRYGKKFSNDNDLVKDTIQDLFLDMIRIRSTLGVNDNIKYYLIVSFRHKLFRKLRKQINLEKITGHIDPEAQITYSVEQEMMDREEFTYREKQVQKGLKELSSKQREILFYRYTCDFDYDQICGIMSLKYDSARKLVCRALKSLKECLSEEDIFLFCISFFIKRFRK